MSYFSPSGRPAPKTVLAPTWRAPLIAVSVAACALWGAQRGLGLASWAQRPDREPFTILLAFVFLLFTWQLFLAWRQGLAEPLQPSEQSLLDSLSVCVNVPCYNERPEVLDRALASIFAQTRLPQHLEVVDDGSSIDYEEVRRSWEGRVPDGMSFAWRRLEANRGKRHAQMATFEHAPEQIFVTVDSDTMLDAHALEEGLKPFRNPCVHSVAGLVLGMNKRRNLLTRVEDLVFTSMQLTVRSAYAQLGSVVVNSGAFALYRASVVRTHADAYLTETILGRRVHFSDDSLLTLYAVATGRAVQQPSAVAYTYWPETWSHHVRQQIRWMRGSSLRTFWRARYLPLNRPAFWLSMLGFAQFLAITALVVYVLGVRPSLLAHNPGKTLAIIAALSYVAMLRSLLIRRSDETLAEKLTTYALSPLGMLWMVFIARALRLYGMCTFMRTGWGTRKKIEHAQGTQPLRLVAH
jgi:hyaluronan synthase